MSQKRTKKTAYWKLVKLHACLATRQSGRVWWISMPRQSRLSKLAFYGAYLKSHIDASRDSSDSFLMEPAFHFAGSPALLLSPDRHLLNVWQWLLYRYVYRYKMWRRGFEEKTHRNTVARTYNTSGCFASFGVTQVPWHLLSHIEVHSIERWPVAACSVVQSTIVRIIHWAC